MFGRTFVNTFVSWYELFRMYIVAMHSQSQLLCKDYESISDAELPRKWIYAQTWLYSGQYIENILRFHPHYQLSEVFATFATLSP